MATAAVSLIQTTLTT